MKRRVFLSALAFVICLALALPVFAQKVKLTVWGIDFADGDPTHAYTKALVDGFRAKYPDIDLDYVALGDDPIKDKIKIGMATNTGLPDVYDSYGGSGMGFYADAGKLLDLTAELRSVPTSSAALTAMTWKGKIYGVAPFFAVGGIFINEGLFKARNLTPPKTYDDLVKVAGALKAAGIQPIACGEKDKWPGLILYMYLTDRYGGSDAYLKAAARKARFDGDAFVKAALLVQDWAKKGYFGDKPLGEAYDDANQLMASGKAGMQVTGSWMCALYASKGYTDQTLGFYPFPTMADGRGPSTDVMAFTDIGFSACAQSASKKDAIVRFMKFAMSPEVVATDFGRVTTVPNVRAPTRLSEMATAVLAKAKVVQFWWDQDLPPTVTTPVTDAIQSFFLPDTDVKNSLTRFENLAIENMGPAK